MFSYESLGESFSNRTKQDGPESINKDLRPYPDEYHPEDFDVNLVSSRLV